MKDNIEYFHNHERDFKRLESILKSLDPIAPADEMQDLNNIFQQLKISGQGLSNELAKREKLIVDQNNYLNSIFSASPMGIGIVVNRVLEFVNDYLLNLLGYEREELIGKSSRILYETQEEFERVGTEKYKQIEDYGYGSINTTFICKNGDKKSIFLSSAKTSKEVLNTPLIFTALDVTTQIAQEKQLKDSEHLLKILTDNSPITLAYVEPEKHIYRFVNHMYFNVFGLSKEQVLGKHVKEVISEKNYEYALPYYQKVEGGELCNYENTFNTINGIRWYSINYIPDKDAEGNVKGIIVLCYDITDIKKMEEELRESREVFLQLFENMKGGVAIYQAVDDGSDFIIIDLNKNGQKHSNVNIDEIRFKKVTEVFPGIKKMGLLDVFTRVYKTGIPENLPLTTYEDDRIKEYVENYVFKLPSGLIVALYDDTSEKHKAINNLKDSENKLKTIFNHQYQSTWFLDIEGRILDINKTALDFLGIDLPLEQNNFFWDSKWWKHSKQQQLEIKEAITNALEGNHVKTEVVAYNFLKKERLFELSILPLYNQKNKISHLVADAHDITDLRNAQIEREKSMQKYVSIFEGADIGILVVEMNGTVCEANSSFLKMIGIEEDKIVGYNALDLANELLDPSVLINTYPILSNMFSGEKVKNHQLEFRGRTFEINVQFNILADQIVAFFRDITDIVIADKALKESNDQVRALARHIESVREEEKVIIAREIHDELGQALTAFKIDLSWLSRHIPDDSPKVKDKLGNMTLLANEILLSIKKISSELRPGILEDLGLQSAFEWHIAEFNKRTGISCVYNIKVKDEDINPQIAINLFRILQEALTNVVKHSGANKVSVNLNNFDNFVKLLIKDNGSGIDLNHKTDYNAFGLIGIKERVLSLNGKMNISGIHKKGTTLEISIPLNNELKNK